MPHRRPDLAYFSKRAFVLSIVAWRARAGAEPASYCGGHGQQGVRSRPFARRGVVRRGIARRDERDPRHNERVARRGSTARGRGADTREIRGPGRPVPASDSPRARPTAPNPLRTCHRRPARPEAEPTAPPSTHLGLPLRQVLHALLLALLERLRLGAGRQTGDVRASGLHHAEGEGCGGPNTQRRQICAPAPAPRPRKRRAGRFMIA